MNGGIALEAITRGLHDVFAALWAGGLLIMAFVVVPTMRLMRDGEPQGVTDPRSAGTPARLPGPMRFVVLLLSGAAGAIGA